MKILKIHCGNFSSLDNFYQNVGISFKINEQEKYDEYDKIELDCSLLNRSKNIRLSVLTSVLSLSYQLKSTFHIPCHIILGNDTSVFYFLQNSNFYLISKGDNIINWELYE